MTEPEIDLNELVILDNTVLSNFAMVQHTDLVTGIWQNCATTPDAWNEFMTGVTLKRISARTWKGLHVVDLSPKEIEFQHHLPSSGRGGGTCLAVAYNQKAILATDDQKARRVGLQWGLRLPEHWVFSYLLSVSIILTWLQQIPFSTK